MDDNFVNSVLAQEWALQYCTWGNESARYSGVLSPLAFNMLLWAVLESEAQNTLPVLKLRPSNFRHFSADRSNKEAAAKELAEKDLIINDGPPLGPTTWIFVIPGWVS